MLRDGDVRRLRAEIVRLRTRGLCVSEIARRVGRSASTVRYHLWFDANPEPEDRRGGFCGNSVMQVVRRKRRAS